MGQACGCGKKDDGLLSDMDDNVHINEEWNKAVIDGSVIGCKMIFENDHECVDQIVDYTTGKRAIHYAVEQEKLELLKFLLENEAEPDYQLRETKNTALHEAAKINHLPMIRLLLTYGANPDIKNSKGHIPRDLAAANFKREFKKSKIQTLKKKAKHTEGPRGNSTRKRSEILINGKPISEQNLGQIRKINENTDTQTEESKRHKAKLEEISNRTDFITDFGRIIGCEVDELGAFFEKMDEEGREELWNKVLKRFKSIDRPTDVKKLLLVITATVVKTKLMKTNKTVKNLRIESTPIEYLVGAIRRKFPRDNRNKKILTKSVYVKKLHLWFYEVHESIDWQETSMEGDSRY